MTKMLAVLDYRQVVEGSFLPHRFVLDGRRFDTSRTSKPLLESLEAAVPSLWITDAARTALEELVTDLEQTGSDWYGEGDMQRALKVDTIATRFRSILDHQPAPLSAADLLPHLVGVLQMLHDEINTPIDNLDDGGVELHLSSGQADYVETVMLLYQMLGMDKRQLDGTSSSRPGAVVDYTSRPDAHQVPDGYPVQCFTVNGRPIVSINPIPQLLSELEEYGDDVNLTPLAKTELWERLATMRAAAQDWEARTAIPLSRTLGYIERIERLLSSSGGDRATA